MDPSVNNPLIDLLLTIYSFFLPSFTEITIPALGVEKVYTRIYGGRVEKTA
jgi:hypothetical protein